MTYDMVIRGGTVADGRGGELIEADVAVEDGRIAAVGEVTGAGTEEIDAKGLLVTPGFVDIHTHYDGQAIWDERLLSSGWHGVTTAVMGNCGVGFAPARADQQEFLMELMQSIEDIPTETLREGVPWGWESFAEYLDCLDETPRAIDVGVLVPHGVVRTYLMGERGEKDDASADEIEAMCGIIGEAIEAGALGCSANRTLLKDGFVPGSFAKDEELLAISKTVGERDGSFQTNPASFYGPRGMGALRQGNRPYSPHEHGRRHAHYIPADRGSPGTGALALDPARNREGQRGRRADVPADPRPAAQRDHDAGGPASLRSHACL